MQAPGFPGGVSLIARAGGLPYTPGGNSIGVFVKNTLIKASAGTGKTYALVTRIIRLMLLGVAPNHIVALTFSRAAAGEIFNRVAERLANAAASPENAAEEARTLLAGLPPGLRGKAGDVTQAVFRRLLRDVIATQHLAMISTIDSFMMRMVQSFPLELGLQRASAIMDDFRNAQEVDAAIRAVLEYNAGQVDELHAAFRLAAGEGEGRSFHEALVRFVEGWHAVYQNHPHAAWGDADVIWPGGEPFREHAGFEEALEHVREEMRPVFGANKREKEWLAVCEAFRQGGFDGTLAQKLLDAWRLNPHHLRVSYYRKEYVFEGMAADRMGAVLETLLARQTGTALRRTQGIHGLLERFDAFYGERTRRRGLLTFADVPRLIARLDASVRSNIEYRFDTQFAHWALDEFQDTSRMQWQAIRNLVDEVTVSEGDRTLFIVGDVKQAIYNWRGGDIGIFAAEAVRPCYEKQSLNKSYRYAPAIAGFVNTVFKGASVAGFLADAAPGAAERWQGLWETHVSAVAGFEGFVSVERVPEVARGGEATELTPFIGAVEAHLNAVRPWTRGITTAILVRNNNDGRAIADALRGAGIPVVFEGDNAVADTPVVAALLHLLAVAEHPGDTLAWRHVAASPLAGLFAGDAGPAAVSRRVLGDVSRLGLAQALRLYTAALPAGDAFTRSRLDALIRAATLFAASADALETLTDFRAYVGGQRERDFAGAGSVKVLTIHRSKGLGFDHVILPLREHGGFARPRLPGYLMPAAGDWLLVAPGREAVGADALLEACRREAVDTAVFESLCTYYVAMTRAKKAMTVLLHPTVSQAVPRLSDHIAEVLGSLPWQCGDAQWFATAGTHAVAGGTPLPREASPTLPGRRPRTTLRRETPSQVLSGEMVAGDLFVPRGRAARERGTELHGELEGVAWPDETPAEALPGFLREPSPLREALRRPPNLLALWRERSFEILVDGVWVSGTFDRVVLFDDGGTRRAVVYDYKTNRKRDTETHAGFEARMRTAYAGQMQSYRRALAMLCGVPFENTRAVLLLVDTRAAVEA